MNEFWINVIHACDHQPDHYRDYIDGQRALQLMDSQGRERGELVWRLATGHTVEITELGIYDPQDRRQGWGSKLLEAAMEDMRSFLGQREETLRRVYLFCEAKNVEARAFYEKQGFRLGALLENFYVDGDAALYILFVK